MDKIRNWECLICGCTDNRKLATSKLYGRKFNFNTHKKTIMMQSAMRGTLAQRSLFGRSQLVATQKCNFAGKDIKFGTEARALMLEGCDMLADAV